MQITAPYSQPPPPQAPGGPAPSPQLKSFGELFSEALRGLKAIRHIVVPFGLLLFFVQGVGPALLFFAPQSVDIGLSLLFTFAGLVLFYLLPIVVFQNLAAREGQQAFGEAIARALKVLIPYAIVLVLSGFVTLGAAFPLLIPGIAVAIFLSVATPAAVLEGRRGFDALARSWALVAGSWWSVFGRMLLLWLVLAALMAALVLPVALISFGTGFWEWYQQRGELGTVLDESQLLKTAEEEFTVPQIITNVVQSAAQIIAAFLSSAFLFMLFTNLKALKGDVMEQKRGKFYALFAWGVVALVVLLAVVAAAILFSAQYLFNEN